MSKKILIVDDEPMLAELLMSMLEARGFTCVTKGSGFEAMEHLKKESVDIIISDLNMPNGDGYYMIEQLKKYNITIPLTICTGSGDESVLADLLSQGVSKCFQKPYSMRQMALDVAQIIETN